MSTDSASSDTAILAELGARVRAHRLGKNMLRETLAKEAGVSLSTLHRLENGQSTQLITLIRVLRVLELVDNLDALVPARGQSPIERMKTRDRPRRRASASANKANAARDDGSWTWGEDR